VPIRTKISEQKSLQSQILQTSATLKSTSSQDEFAKWARLNRQHDKQIDDLKTVNSVVDGHKAKFRRVVGITVWLGTTGVKGGVQWWYKKEPVFWLPAGTFPYWVEYIVAFPKAPKGIQKRFMELMVRECEYDGVWDVC
jgi:tail-anchored protein insertion receptor